MSNYNVETFSLKDNNTMIQSKDEENNIIQVKRNIEIVKTKFLKIPYFYIGKTINFYFPFTQVSIEEFKYPIFSLGCEKKIFLIIFMYISIIYSLIYYLLNKLFYSTIFNLGIPFLLIIIMISSIILFLINPGIVYKTEILNLENTNKCEICGINYNKNLKIKHCKLCDVCVIGYDHHCGVIGKCVGKKNFFLFIFTTFLFGIYQIILIYQIYKIIDFYYIKKK